VGTARRESASAPPEDPGDPPPIIFDRFCAFAKEQNRGLFSALEGGRLVARDGGRIEIQLATSLAVRRLEARIGELEAVCERFFGGPTRVTLTASEPPTPGSAPGPADDRAVRQRKEALSHPNVNQALEILGGEIVEIRPLGGER
jgi:hypothetical protein